MSEAQRGPSVHAVLPDIISPELCLLREKTLKAPEAGSVSKIAAALEVCYASMEALCADLTDGEWRAQSLCPDWNGP